MFERFTIITFEVMNNVFNNLYIGLLVTACTYTFCKPQIDNLYKHITNINKNQNILYQSILKIKSIVNIDNSLSNEQIDELKKEIRTIKSIINDDDLNSEESQDSYEQESSDINISPKNNIVLPIQNHITFPRFFIFNEKNFKQTKLTDNDYEFRFIGKDLRLISNELAKVLKVKSGTCMDFEDAYIQIFNYIQDNNITNMAEDSKLRYLFGINENEDYECSVIVLIQILKKILEPHLKKLLMNIIRPKQ